MISRLLEGEFLDYERAIPAGAKIEITVPTRRFIEAVERMSLVVNERLKSPIRCVFEDNEARFSCETAIGTAIDHFSIGPVAERNRLQ